jgi:PAP2 superfamily
MSTAPTDDRGSIEPADRAAPDPEPAAAASTGLPRWRAGRTLSDGSRIYWWKEVLIVVVVDVIYETVRNLSSASKERAYDNAIRIIDWQKTLGIWHEHGMQHWALDYTPLIVVANYFYGSVYIAATIFGLVFLYRWHSDDYPLWRNTLAIGTLLGLIGFATFPLMPPRLLDVMGPGNFGFVDTLLTRPTFWSFESEGMKTISNQFAAMPSLHCGWAFWGLAVFFPRSRQWWAKALAVLYPIATIYVVVITGNHFFLDAVGGLAIMLVGYAAARVFTRAGRRPPLDADAGSDADAGEARGAVA